MKKELSRRSFLKISSLMGTNAGLAGAAGMSVVDVEEVIEDISDEPERKGNSVIGLKDDPISPVNVGIIGLGNRGTGMTKLVNAMYPQKARIQAICDLRKERVEAVLNVLQENGQDPDTYSGSEDAWKDLADRGDLDLVLVFTNWNMHVPMSVYSMKQDKHVAMEVPAAYTVDGCWKLVNTAEEMQKHCMMLENVCYGSEELWLLNMAKQGVLGELTYAEASYIHNLRENLFGQNRYYKQWRLRHHVERNGNLYPTHGLGPVAQYLDIQRGDRFKYLVSVSSPQASLTEHSKTVDPSNEFHDRSDFEHGDMNNSLVKTEKGRSILVQHDVVTPRPYSRTNALAGTKGYHEGYPSRLSLSEKGHRWLNDEEYKEYRSKYNHPIREELSEEIEKYGGHGGMDFVELYRLFDNLNKGRTLDMDVYDAAAWSVVSPLSEISVELDGVPVKFPDFTRGKWKKKRKLNMIKQF